MHSEFISKLLCNLLMTNNIAYIHTKVKRELNL